MKRIHCTSTDPNHIPSCCLWASPDQCPILDTDQVRQWPNIIILRPKVARPSQHTLVQYLRGEHDYDVRADVIREGVQKNVFPKCGWVGWLIPKQGPNPSKAPRKSPFSTQISPFVFSNLTKTLGWVSGFKDLGKFSHKRALFWGGRGGSHYQNLSK